MQAAAPLVLHVFSSFEVGGAQVRFAAIANRYGPAFRHAIIAMDGQTACSTRLAPELDVQFPEITIRKGDTIGNIRRFRRLLRAMRPDVMVTNSWGAIEWAIANALPVVRHVHMEDGFGVEEQSRQIPRRAMLRRIFLRRSEVVLPSRTLCRIATEAWKLDPARVRYIPNGVDLARFVPDDAVRGLRPACGAALVIGTVAGLRPEKNVARLIRAFALVAAELPARLVIAGEGSERARLDALVAEHNLGDRVHFAGQVERPELLYRDFDVFALASDTEQMPLSVLEAMASGLPVASTDVGDVADMVALENREFLTPRDDVALAHALLRLLRDGAQRERLGRANRDKALREYDQEAMFTRHAALLGAPPAPNAPAQAAARRDAVPIRAG